MQDTLFLTEKKEKTKKNKTPHIRCPLCAGKLKASGERLFCKKCGFYGAEKDLIEKINHIYKTDIVENDAENKTKSAENNAESTESGSQNITEGSCQIEPPVIFYCGTKTKAFTQKIKSFGYKAYCYVSELLSEIKPEQKVYFAYDETTKDAVFFNIANKILQKTQNILAIKVQVEQVLNIKDKEKLNTLFKESLFSAYKNMIFRMEPMIKNLKTEKQKQLIDSFLELTIYIKDSKITPFAFERLLNANYNCIAETVFK
jgi:hypothetical protein